MDAILIRQLWMDVLLGEFLSWLALTSSAGELRPEVHLELAEIHGLLAKHYRECGWRWLASRFAAWSAAHWWRGGGGAPPRAVALALAVPEDTPAGSEDSDVVVSRGPRRIGAPIDPEQHATVGRDRWGATAPPGRQE